MYLLNKGINNKVVYEIKDEIPIYPPIPPPSSSSSSSGSGSKNKNARFETRSVSDSTDLSYFPIRESIVLHMLQKVSKAKGFCDKVRIHMRKNFVVAVSYDCLEYGSLQYYIMVRNGDQDEIAVASNIFDSLIASENKPILETSNQIPPPPPIFSSSSSSFTSSVVPCNSSCNSSYNSSPPQKKKKKTTTKSIPVLSNKFKSFLLSSSSYSSSSSSSISSPSEKNIIEIANK
jgi:hypothetical protein